ncbi:MAG TPA: cytochrome c [Azonexus sp.]|nr:cytochrome c [Azonexus sp.]
MKIVTLLLANLLIAPPVLAADPWGNADPKLGKEHHDKACVACHVRLQGGDGSKMYTRDNRLLSTKLGIMKRVTTCNAQTKAGLLPEEEAQVAAYLNQQFYHFKE